MRRPDARIRDAFQRRHGITHIPVSHSCSEGLHGWCGGHKTHTAGAELARLARLPSYFPVALRGAALMHASPHQSHTTHPKIPKPSFSSLLCPTFPELTTTKYRLLSNSLSTSVVQSRLEKCPQPQQALHKSLRARISILVS